MGDERDRIVVRWVGSSPGSPSNAPQPRLLLMIMLHRLAAFSLLLAPLIIAAADTPLRAQDFVVQEHQLTAGGPVNLLSGWACWFGDCSFANCHMETTKKPQLGALRVAVKPATIPSTGGACAGHATPGLYVTYT